MLHDLLTAFRSLRRHPAFTSLVVLTLGLGIGATVTVFSVAEAVLLRPLPYPDGHQLVDIAHASLESEQITVDRRHLPGLRDQSDVFQDVGARRLNFNDVTFQIGDSPPAHARGLWVSYNYLSILGIEPFLGRTFLLEDAIPTVELEGEAEEATPRTPSVILTHGLWQRAMGSDPNITERSLTIEGRQVDVVGILPRNFRLLHERSYRWVQGSSVDLFVVIAEEVFTYPGGPSRSYLPLARLHREVTPEQAQAALGRLAARFRAEEAEYEREELRFRVRPLRVELTAESRPILLVLTGGVLFLMLLVCANLANLMLVRGRIRSREDAIRATVGCGRLRLAGHRLAESILLVLAGGTIGIGVAWAGIRMVEVMAPRTIPLMDQVGMNVQAVLTGLCVALVLVLLLGLISAFQVGRLNLVRTLNSETRGASGKGRQRLMNTLVVSELALAMILIAGAGVMVRTLKGLGETDLGFDGEQVITFDLSVFAEEFRSREAMAAIYAELGEKLGALPGVAGVARTGMAPLSGKAFNRRYGWDEESLERAMERADINICTEDYFDVMGTRLLAGRFFTRAEATDSTESVIVDEDVAGIAWPGEDPIGKRLLIWGGFEGVVVGVVERMLMRDFGMLDLETIYLPVGNFWAPAAGTFVVRTGAHLETLLPSIRQALLSVHPTLVPYNVQMLADRVNVSMAPTRFLIFLMGSFAAIALLVAVTGLFGVIAYAVQTRTAELGTRMALGAEQGRIMSMVLCQGALLTGLGILTGIVGALFLARFIESVVFGVSPTDPIGLLVTAVALGAVSILACYAPARWACRLDPAQVLRTE
jgi:predicted permease